MSHGQHSRLPIPWKADLSRPPDADHQTKEWTSGARGGGYVPDDFEWGTNPKQEQEEQGVTGHQQDKR